MPISNSPIDLRRPSDQLPVPLESLPVISQPYPQLADASWTQIESAGHRTGRLSHRQSFAIFRFRFDTVHSQAARSRRAIAVSAGPARRSSTSCSFQTPF